MSSTSKGHGNLIQSKLRREGSLKGAYPPQLLVEVQSLNLSTVILAAACLLERNFDPNIYFGIKLEGRPKKWLLWPNLL